MDPEFTLSVGCNPWIESGRTDLTAALTVTCGTGADPAAEVAEVIVIDRSESMSGAKLDQAKRAAKSALEVVRDGALFAVVAGGYEAVPQYPRDGTLTRATRSTRRAAAKAIDAMKCGSSTRTGVWLRHAADLLASRPDAIGHVLLLTDGLVTQKPEDFRRDLEYCRGRFGCDSVGIGLNWSPAQLAEIAEAFQGRFKFCERLDELPAYFADISERAMSKAADGVELRVFASEETELVSMDQMGPVVDLVPGHRPLDGRGWAFPLAAWGAEEREYVLGLRFPATDAGMRENVRVEVRRGGERLAGDRIEVGWTEDHSLFLAFDPKVAALTGQLELSEDIGRILAAVRARDFDTATREVARAYEKAEDGGFAGMKDTLARIAEIDPVTRSVTIKRDLDRADELYTGSQRFDTEKSSAVMGRKEDPT
ncbi:VWA domain-containing protein [Glycomyces mayteni]|uniref:VWA domain-containing protein n=1 Tax=Glycomyces mayteni TaxID=543887 RepID=A0ABW2DC59_9ACTN|nr:VWA domain-containing protein [Glycomyces mayteni]